MKFTDPAGVAVGGVNLNLTIVKDRRENLQALLNQGLALIVVDDVNSIEQVITIPAHRPDRLSKTKSRHIFENLVREDPRGLQLLIA